MWRMSYRADWNIYHREPSLDSGCCLSELLKCGHHRVLLFLWGLTIRVPVPAERAREPFRAPCRIPSNPGRRTIEPALAAPQVPVDPSVDVTAARKAHTGVIDHASVPSSANAPNEMRLLP